MFDGGVGRAGGDALCVTRYAGVGGTGSAGGDALCALRMLEFVEGGLCLLEVLEVLEVPEPEAMHCVLLRMLESGG